MGRTSVAGRGTGKKGTETGRGTPSKGRGPGSGALLDNRSGKRRGGKRGGAEEEIVVPPEFLERAGFSPFDFPDTKNPEREEDLPPDPPVVSGDSRVELSERLAGIGHRLAKNIASGDKKKAFRQFELDLAQNFSSIILAGAGSAVKGFIDSLLTIEEFRERKTPDMEGNRKSATTLLEEFFTKKES